MMEYACHWGVFWCGSDGPGPEKKTTNKKCDLGKFGFSAQNVSGVLHILTPSSESESEPSDTRKCPCISVIERFFAQMQTRFFISALKEDAQGSVVKVSPKPDLRKTKLTN